MMMQLFAAFAPTLTRTVLLTDRGRHEFVPVTPNRAPKLTAVVLTGRRKRGKSGTTNRVAALERETQDDRTVKRRGGVWGFLDTDLPRALQIRRIQHRIRALDRCVRAIKQRLNVVLPRHVRQELLGALKRFGGIRKQLTGGLAQQRRLARLRPELPPFWRFLEGVPVTSQIARIRKRLAAADRKVTHLMEELLTTPDLLLAKETTVDGVRSTLEMRLTERLAAFREARAELARELRVRLTTVTLPPVPKPHTVVRNLPVFLNGHGLEVDFTLTDCTIGLRAASPSLNGTAGSAKKKQKGLRGGLNQPQPKPKVAFKDTTIRFFYVVSGRKPSNGSVKVAGVKKLRAERRRQQAIERASCTDVKADTFLISKPHRRAGCRTSKVRQEVALLEMLKEQAFRAAEQAKRAELDADVKVWTDAGVCSPIPVEDTVWEDAEATYEEYRHLYHPNANRPTISELRERYEGYDPRDLVTEADFLAVSRPATSKCGNE